MKIQCQFKYKSFDFFFKIIYLFFGCAVPLEVKEWGPNHWTSKESESSDS